MWHVSDIWSIIPSLAVSILTLLDLASVTFSSSDIRPCFLSVLSFPISIPLALSPADYIRLPLSSLLSLITPIVDRPLHYLVADSLSLYRCSGFYLVRYLTSQSSGTVGLGLCPLRLLTLLARGCPAVYKMYQYSTWTLSLSFRAIKTSEHRIQRAA